MTAHVHGARCSHVAWPITPDTAPWRAPYVQRADDHAVPGFDDEDAARALIAEDPDRLLVRVYDDPRRLTYHPAVYPWPTADPDLILTRPEDPAMLTTTTREPVLRVRWEDDPEPYDGGDAMTPEEVACYIAHHGGPMGCVVEECCSCCSSWSVVTSLWSVLGDEEYREQVAADMLDEARAMLQEGRR